MTGRTIGPFQLGDTLGVGGMGIVYRAVHTQSGQEVAVKILSPVMSADEQVQKRFVREMEILKRLEHKNIIRYYGGGADGELCYYAMEIMDGGTLEDVLKKRERLSWEQTIDAAKSIALALEHAHYKGIIHRDLKPANLFLTKKGRLKIGDFGIARDTGRTALTAAGKTVGTYAYMAPEQIAGKPPVSRHTDLYALGCVMFQLLTGRVPFEADNAAAMLMQHLELKPPRVTAYAVDCPIWLERLVFKLLEKDPEDRYYDALAVHTALNDVREKVAKRTGIARQTAAGDVTVLAATTSQEKRELSRLLGKKRKKKKRGKAPFYEKAWFLAVCLLFLISAVTWAMWPLSDEEKFNRGQSLMKQAARLNKNDDERFSLIAKARDDYFEPLLESAPDGSYAEKIRVYLLDIKTDQTERRVESRLKRNRRPKPGVEQDYMDARRAEMDGDRITALARYRNLITLFGERDADRPYVTLAQRRIKSIQRAGSSGNIRRQIVLEGLKNAKTHLEKSELIEAERIYSAIIDEYGKNRELQSLVNQAREAHKRLLEKTPE